MAQGDFLVFNEFKANLSAATNPVALNSGTFKIGLITNVAAPTQATATPDWADFSANEVSGNGYTAGGATATVTYAMNGANAQLTLDANVSWTSTGTGDANNIYWAILYQDNNAGTSDAVGYIEMGTSGNTVPLDLNNGDITINSGTLFTLS